MDSIAMKNQESKDSQEKLKTNQTRGATVTRIYN